jgi:hypothetical protein
MITTYTELQAAIASQMHRSDLTSRIPDFIQLAEKLMFRELSVSELETSTSGTATEFIAFPADLGEINRLEITFGGMKSTIDYTSPNGIEGLTEASGVPARYTVQGNQIRLIPAPTGTITYSLYYTPNVTGLSDTNQTNWLLENAPDLYLYAACVEASRFLFDDESVMRYRDYVAVLLDSVRRKDERRRLSGAGALQIKPRNAV